MRQFLNKYIYLLLTFLISFIIFYPSLFTFFTNDDFFFLNVSRAVSAKDFINFFSLAGGPEGFGMYRPLTTQAFYFLSWSLFKISPFPLHIISFIFFFAIVYLVYKLTVELTKNEKVGLISAFLYAVSATHFGQLYYLAAFQELGMTFFVLLSCLSFIKRKNILSLIFFVLGLMSKETAVVTPILLFLIYIYQKHNKDKVVKFKKLLIALFPFVVCLLAYMFIRFRWYGFATGDSYIWDFSIRKLFNTTAWYLLWSLNLPESLVDYVGSGFKINPNLFLFWGNQIRLILILFAVELFFIIYALVRSLSTVHRSRLTMSIFCLVWFVISLLPVIFLPLHKFSFYLTLPIFGVVFLLSYLLSTVHRSLFTILFCMIWAITSILTLRFTYDTNWITQSELVSQRVYEYFQKEESKYTGAKIVFSDTKNDLGLPWSPTGVVRTVLSTNNFFKVFFPELANNVSYFDGGVFPSDSDVVINSRQFLGY